LQRQQRLQRMGGARTVQIDNVKQRTATQILTRDPRQGRTNPVDQPRRADPEVHRHQLVQRGTRYTDHPVLNHAIRPPSEKLRPDAKD